MGADGRLGKHPENLRAVLYSTNKQRGVWHVPSRVATMILTDQNTPVRSPLARAQEFHEVFPHLITAANVPKLVKTGDVNWDGVDAAFCCLPHATTQVRPAFALLIALGMSLNFQNIYR